MYLPNENFEVRKYLPNKNLKANKYLAQQKFGRRKKSCLIIIWQKKKTLLNKDLITMRKAKNKKSKTTELF